MNSSLAILLALTLAAASFAFYKDSQLPLRGLLSTGRLLRSVWLELTIGFVLAGLIDVLVPSRTLAAWLGTDNPVRGILVGWGAGLLIPGGPYLVFPIIAGLFQKGAAAGALIALLTSKTLVSPIRMLTYEAPLLGWPLTLARILPALFVPPLLGLLGHVLYALIQRK